MISREKCIEMMLEVGLHEIYSGHRIEALATAPEAPQAQDKARHALYEELIYAVGSKWPNESRHQTALRYIQQSEAGRQPTIWEPIDTAPKDGSQFLSVTKLDDGSYGCVGISHISYLHSIGRDGKPQGYVVCGANPLATLWMPLPVAPQSRIKESK